MIPSLLSEEFQAAQQLASNAAADPTLRRIADGALARMQDHEIEIPADAHLDWRKGCNDPSLPLRMAG